MHPVTCNISIVRECRNPGGVLWPRRSRLVAIPRSSALAAAAISILSACTGGTTETTATPSPTTPTTTSITTTLPPSTTHVTTTTTTSGAPEPTLLSEPVTPFTAKETFQAALGDVDGDGDLDAVLANPRHNQATVWLGDGNGAFTDTGQLLTYQGHGVGLADFDGDGDLDTFITCHGFPGGATYPSHLYRNDGSGAFTDSGMDFGDGDLSGVELQVLDLQDDGSPDVYVAYYDPAGMPDRVYVDDGAGSLTDSGMRIEDDVVTWGDLDGDGDADMFATRYEEGYVVRQNDGTGAFADLWSFAEPTAAEGAIALADFDADGDLDALVGSGRGAAAGPAKLFWNDGAGSFTPSDVELGAASAAEFGVADLDGDGHLDVVVANADFVDEVWLGDGAGGFAASEMPAGSIPSDGLSTKVSLGDIDGDGDLDVIVGSLGAPARLYLNLSG
jgi:hypothetical protein